MKYSKRNVWMWTSWGAFLLAIGCLLLLISFYTKQRAERHSLETMAQSIESSFCVSLPQKVKKAIKGPEEVQRVMDIVDSIIQSKDIKITSRQKGVPQATAQAGTSFIPYQLTLNPGEDRIAYIDFLSILQSIDELDVKVGVTAFKVEAQPDRGIQSIQLSLSLWQRK